MIQFKILCFICLCFILTKVIGVQKYPNNTVVKVDSGSQTLKNVVDQKNDKLILNSPIKQVKKKDKINSRDEKFKLNSGNEDIQLQKNSMQNSFQSVYDQVFVVNDNPKTSKQIGSFKNKTSPHLSSLRQPLIRTNKINLSKSKSRQPISPVYSPFKSIPIISSSPKPPIKEHPPIYHFNKRPIVYQCCRYVFPAELYFDHLLFYTKYGHTYNSNETPKTHQSPSHLNQFSGQTIEKTKDSLEKESAINEPLNVPNLDEIKIEKPNEIQTNVQLDQPIQRNELEKNESEKLRESSDDKSNEKIDNKNEETIKEPDESSTNLFRTWQSNNHNNNNNLLYNFGSCTPIYELSQTHIQNMHPIRTTRWPLFG